MVFIISSAVIFSAKALFCFAIAFFHKKNIENAIAFSKIYMHKC
uniref:Uncharacterized protein n=1 Tax=uncultured bacterium contig00092 TaxID=1181563 RepID=A0A806KLR1_9BACT|nr:hypothetical protein [uncultured bacterium contig00092]